jgi:hypothetical protein
LGKFEIAWQYARRGVQLWRSGPTPAEEVADPAVGFLIWEALCGWHFGEIAASHAAMAEAISLAKAAHDPHVLALALWGAAVLGVCERNPAEVDRVAAELME